MNPEKVGKFIKDLRKNNHLTQAQFADKYGVTYQAVSKWENGLNLPDVSLIRQISKDFNISVEDILDGEISNNKEKHSKRNILIIILVIIFIIIIISLIIYFNNKSSFNFKTISSNCNEFNVSGSIAYDKAKSSIYISNVNYCGGNDENIYEKIECNLYENANNTDIKISSCKSNESGITLEDYLKEVELNIDNYERTCKNYTNNSLYLEINAFDKNNNITTYKIPLSLNENCSKN